MGSGGMRFGAGRPGWKRKAASSLPFNIHEVTRRGLLSPGTAFKWTWTNGDGERLGSVYVRVSSNPEKVTLYYQWSANGGLPQSMEYPIWIERTACFYGGNRPWFLCPSCGRRCGVLYFSGRGAGLYKCRDCARVTYTSQCQDAVDRSWIKQRKIEARLADGDRPKGMHLTTYERLRDIIWNCDLKGITPWCT